MHNASASGASRRASIGPCIDQITRSTPASKNAACRVGQARRFVVRGIPEVDRAGDLAGSRPIASQWARNVSSSASQSDGAAGNVMSHWSAHRAAVRNVRLRPLPPITSGSLAWTGLGSHHASVTSTPLEVVTRLSSSERTISNFVNAVVEQRADDLDAFVEPVEPLLEGAQLDPVRPRFHLVPTGADAELEPSAGDDVERRRHVGRDGRVAVVHAVDHRSEAQARRGLGERGEHRPGFEVGTVVGRRQRVEVVPVPRRFEHVDLIRLAPEREVVGPGGVMRRRLDGVSSEARMPADRSQDSGFIASVLSVRSCPRWSTVAPARPSVSVGSARWCGCS